MTDDAEIIVTAFGITARIARTAVTAAREKGIKAGLFRPITLWPFPTKRLRELADKADRFLCVEMNKGQMVYDIKLATESGKAGRFLRPGMCQAEILNELEKLTGKGKE